MIPGSCTEIIGLALYRTICYRDRRSIFYCGDLGAMMKFTGLILICATSALSLLLPALGMVKFPMVDQRTESSSLTSSSTSPSPPAGLPIATPAFTGLSGSTPAEGNANPAPNIQTPTSMGAPSLLGPPWTRQKVSLNAWLMLGPVMLLGIALWTFAPNRGGSGR